MSGDLQYKLEWQRNMRRRFQAEHGFSSAANYSNGKLRTAVLERDGYACVQCRMTDAEHKEKWNRPITVDHRDRNKKHNTMDNLQTLCLSCHGRKDLIPRLRHRKWEQYKDQILSLRAKGLTYNEIGATLRIAPSTAYICVEKSNV